MQYNTAPARLRLASEPKALCGSELCYVCDKGREVWSLRVLKEATWEAESR